MLISGYLKGGFGAREGVGELGDPHEVTGGLGVQGAVAHRAHLLLLPPQALRFAQHRKGQPGSSRFSCSALSQPRELGKGREGLCANLGNGQPSPVAPIPGRPAGQAAQVCLAKGVDPQGRQLPGPDLSLKVLQLARGRRRGGCFQPPFAHRTQF